jgi:small subunit ribosomal protein S8e
MLTTTRSNRMPSGGKRSSLRRRDKRLSELANHPANTSIADKEVRKQYRGKGGNVKTKLMVAKKVNLRLLDGKTAESSLISVSENNANREFVRRNIVTKGAKIVVELKGNKYAAKVTSRPGQAGIVSAIALDEEVIDTKKKKKAAPKKKE